MSLLTVWAVFWRRAKGARLADLGYRFTKESIVAGVVAAMIFNPWTEIALSRIDISLFGPEREIMGLKEAGALAALLVLLANGFLAPIVEEYAWRGVIQNHFRRAWGVAWAVIATAVLFTLKHLLGDISLARTTQVLAFSFLVCIVAARWGTGASTITHVLANTASTTFWILDTFGVIQFY